MRWLSLSVLACLVVFFDHSAAGPLPETFPFTIRSAYLESRTGKWNKETQWTFAQSNEGRISVTLEGAKEPIVVLEYGPDGRIQRIEKKIDQTGKRAPVIEIPSGPLVLSEGFPVPFDYLAPHDDSIRQVMIKKKAGGVTFSFKVAREILEITLDEAMAENMIDEQMARSLAGKGLRLITVRKGEELLVRQLWPEGASWWVYEETPIRKSWRMPLSRNID